MGLTSDEEDEESTPIIRQENRKFVLYKSISLFPQFYNITDGGGNTHSATEYLQQPVN